MCCNREALVLVPKVERKVERAFPSLADEHEGRRSEMHPISAHAFPSTVICAVPDVGVVEVGEFCSQSAFSNSRKNVRSWRIIGRGVWIRLHLRGRQLASGLV
jgi:hypothetical protein